MEVISCGSLYVSTSVTQAFVDDGISTFTQQTYLSFPPYNHLQQKTKLIDLFYKCR